MGKRTFLLFALLLFWSGSASAAFHAIIVCDTLASNIGAAVEADLNLMKREARTIAKHIGHELKEQVFKGEEVTRNLLKTIESTPINGQDIVLFYFSGHGYRTPSKKENIWPNLYFTPEHKGEDFYAVVQRLQEKKPRLIIAIADVCNNIIPDAFAPPLFPKGMKLKHCYAELFLNQTGTIIISGCIPGQYSWCTVKGGIYTHAFLYSLHAELHSKEPSWQAMLDRASLIVMKKKELDQTPQYELLLN